MGKKIHRLYNKFVNVMYFLAVPPSRDQIPIVLDAMKIYSKDTRHYEILLPKGSRREDFHSNEPTFS